MVKCQWSVAVRSIITDPDRYRVLVAVIRLSVESVFELVVILAIRFTIKATSALAVELVTRFKLVFDPESYPVLSIAAHSGIRETFLFKTQFAIASSPLATLLRVLLLCCGKF